MIIFKRFYVGNNEKTYIEKRFKPGLNIIHSDDNNKGKTIVTQGLMYALGNNPIFPKGFDDYENYYFIVDVNVNDVEISICRKKDYFIVLEDNVFRNFESVNDFKRFFSEHICKLPIINKNDVEQLAGLELFFEMFFLPQDNRLTSNIINKGRYNKEDYMNFIYSMLNCDFTIDENELNLLKEKIAALESERKTLRASSKLLKSKKIEAQFATYTASKDQIDKKLKNINDCKESLSKLINEKSRLLNKKLKNEILLKEINSLNKKLEVGKLVCLDCKSDRIGYESSNQEVKFEITDNDIRRQIKIVIEEKINIYNEDLNDLEEKILKQKQVLSELMADSDVTLENLLFYKKDIVDASQYDLKISEIDKEIEMAKSKVKKTLTEKDENKISKLEIDDGFIKEMKYFYNSSEPRDPLTIESIFTKNDVNYSGSQEALYLMSRIYACTKVLKSDFPIIIDDFRGGELSTIKEEKVIDLFKQLNKQVILTCTLKNEENNKYNKDEEINDISFDEITSFNLLQEENIEEFKNKLRSFLLYRE